MGLDMNLEADVRLNRNDVERVFQRCGVTDFAEEDYGFSGYFPVSGMRFSAYATEDVEWARAEVIAEGADGMLTWKVGMRVVFRLINAVYDECSADLHKFLEELARNNDACFVLSFQYEGLYAIRDTDGLRILRKF